MVVVYIVSLGKCLFIHRGGHILMHDWVFPKVEINGTIILGRMGSQQDQILLLNF